MIEAKIQRKAETSKLDKLHKRVEELEQKIKKLEEDTREEKTWADITDNTEKRTVEEAVEKCLWDRETEEKDRQNRRNNIIVFGLPELKTADGEQRKSEDIQRMIGLCKNICQVNISDMDINRVVRL